MMKIANQSRYVLLTLLIMCFAAAWGQQVNVLSVADAKVSIGQAQLPVAIENTDEIVAVQFDLTLPSTISAGSDAVLTNRCDGHTVIIRNMSATRYRVMLYSDDNRPLIAQKGTVFYIPLIIPQTVEDGSELPLVISNATLSVASGENVVTGTSAGKLIVSKLPDLTVKSVHAESTAITPGEVLSLSWQVQNVGGTITGSGWSEQIMLVNKRGTVTKLIGTVYQQETLAPGEVMSRQADIMVPQLLGIEGEAHILVKVVANSETGESTLATGNNTRRGEQAFNVAKRLFVETNPARITEGGTHRVAVKVNRSGDWSSEQTFALSAKWSIVNGQWSIVTTDSRVQLPTQITIPVGQSGAAVYMTVSDNNVLDESETVTITASGNNYPDETGALTIEDNEYPNLSLTASKSDLTEGETFQLTVTASRAVEGSALDITLTSENTKRFSFPQTVTIPAGETSVTVDVTAIEDETPSLDLSNAFTVSAPKYNKAELLVILSDNDMPVLELELTPTTVQESAGPIAVAGVLRRTTKTDSKITVKLSDDANGGLYFGNRTLELAKGVEEVHFNFGPVDNAIVDGDRTYTITAAVWISSCSCGASGESAGYVTAQLNVLDNDGPALNLTSSLSTVKEGGRTILTISRNTNDTSTPLTVTLNSDYEDGLTFDHTVTIPAGEQSTTVEVTSAANSVQGDSHTVIFTVQADGYAKGTCFVMVTDQTLPDARISSINADATEAEVGTQVKLTIEVTNDGAAELPAGVAVKVYHRGESNAVATQYTSEPLAIGGSLTLNKTITLPTTIGNHNYYAVVNESNKVQELSYNNNTSQDVIIKAIAPFSVVVSTDKSIYNQGEKIIISGQLTGNGTANTTVDLYVINEGARQVQQVITDAQGVFTYEWQLYALQSGHFVVGACYPNEGLRTEMASFDVYGLKRTEYSNITCDVICGDTKTGNLGLKNPGNLDLTEVTIEMLSVPETCEAQMNIPSKIGGDQEVQLSYSVKGVSPTAENKWEEIKARVNTKEGISLDITLYFYCRNAQGKLVASTQRIVTTMNKDKGREYSIQVTNIGRGNTGKISLALPDFIKSLAGSNLPSINQNDTLNIPLCFMPTNDMQLNVPITGQLGINCENGEGVPINFTITPVSDETGTLVVDVCDEYTYYTEEAPHVEGAEVVVRNPVTGALVTQGKTDADGLFTVVLPEGYYKLSVTANNHDSYTNNVLVDPGEETRKVINLTAQAITVDWKVEETEVEDEYEIVTTVKFETNVPSPVVELVVPKSLDVDALGVGESLVFYAVLTNKGLITAQDAELILPEGFKRITFEPLTQYQGLTIAPQQSIFIPVKVTRITPSNSRMRRLPDIDDDPCVGQPGTLYFWDCGEDRKWHRYGIAMQLGSCNSNDPSTWDNSGNGGGNTEWTGGWPSGVIINAPNLPGGSSFGSSFYQGLQGGDEGCEPCQNRFLYKMVKCITGRIPVFKEFWEIIDWVEDPIEKGTDELRDKALNRLEDGAKRLKPVYGWVKRFIKYADIWGDCIEPLYEPCDPGNFNGSRRYRRRANSDNNPSYIKEYQETLALLTSAFDAEIARTIELFGDSIWIRCNDEELSLFIDKFVGFAKDEISLEDLNSSIPQNVPNNQLSLFIERWNNTINNNDTENKIDIDKYDEYGKIINSVIQYANNNGYLSMMDMYEEAEEKVLSKLNDASKSVCSTVTLQFKQTMTMTRQAFRGTLTVFNGNETTAMTDMKLTLNVTNRSTGELATAHEFQINAESLDGFTGELDLGSGWTLAANSTGTATVLFIPTKYAAPTEPVEWSFGGTLSYIDPFTGLEVTRELYPVTLTVKPSPELDLTYFMQRDVYGDDALTLDVVEPMKPAEFALLINNKGNGDATNVRMVTQQPEIIENEKGLYIDFELISSQVNGNEAHLSFGQSISNDFGTIPAHSQMYAQWWLTSTLLGHFIDYKVEATHVTSYGNEDLSLLDQVTIHELIHGFDMPTGSLTGGPEIGRAFLVNDVTDAEDLPDKIYFSNGDTASVAVATTAQIVRTSPTTCLLTITPSASGWNYGSLIDPTHGYAELKSIVRQSDGTELGNTRFWQTDRTLRDGKDWLYEYRMHFVDEFNSTSPVTYVLTFDPVPEKVLEVASIATLPEEGDIATEYIKKLTVDFNKPIDASTFTGDDITFAVQGVKQDANQIAISTKDNKSFTLDMSAMNDALPNGYYTLTVQTADITDTEGFLGRDGKQVGWILFRGGLVQLLTSAWPENSGTVLRKSQGADARLRRAPADENSATYGSTVTFEAEPAEGYEFSNWTLNGEVVSTNPVFTTTALGDMNVVANFTKKKYKVEIAENTEGGTVSGFATGIYDYGTKMTLTATPQEDYVFKGWIVNGKSLDDHSSVITLTATKAMEISAMFEREYYRHTMTLARGWNWVSSYLNEPLDVADFGNYVNRILSQEQEIINDPQYGMVGNLTELIAGKAYKIESNTRVSNVLRGHLYNNSTNQINLHRGWNWIGYPLPNMAAIDQVIDTAEDGDYIASQTGFAEYDDGYWEGSIERLIPGEGYLYKSVTEKNLSFNMTDVAHSRRALRHSSDREQSIDIHAYPNTMNMTAKIYRNEQEVPGDMYNVYAFAGNEMRGISEYVGSHHYLTVYGSEDAEITFIVESLTTGETFLSNETLRFRDDVVGSRKSPYILHIGSATGIESLTDNGRPMTVYSLEGILISRNATLKALRKLPKGVYIVNGQKCFIK